MPSKNHFQIDEYYLDLQKKAQGLEIIDQEATQKRPFPGLRPFRTSEAHLFFGREGISRKLLKTLFRQSNFLAILGASGSGKSSLVRASLIPSLHAGKAQQQNFNWRIVICRPGNRPMANLAAALASAKVQGGASVDDLQEITSEILSKLNESSYGILEVLEEFKDNYEKTLVIIDQFEELFRFSSGSEESNKGNRNFVNLLLTASGLEDSPVYVVITMRSEFLGECVKFRNLPEAINNGQYLIPRLSTQNVADAIEGPVAVAGKSITKALVNRLIHDLGDNMDQLPVLQHALMCTYDLAVARSADKAKLTVADYEEVGGMEKALSNHATRIYESLGRSGSSRMSRKQQIAKLIFQRLTDETAGLKGGRYPTPLYKLYNMAQAKPLVASREEVDEVVNAFRNEDTSFLMPPADTALKDELVIDISHESLMRNWDLLIGDHGWIHEEFEDGKKYRQLQERRRENEIISGGLLDELIIWEKTSGISPTWAKRYSTSNDTPQDYVENLEFLEKCVKQRRIRTMIRQVTFLAGLAVLIIMVVLRNQAVKAENKAETERIRSIFETLKRSNPTLSYNAIDKWLEYSESKSKELLNFQKSFHEGNSYLKATLPLSYDLNSLVSLQSDRISISEGDSISTWDIKDGILLGRIEDTTRNKYFRPDLGRRRYLHRIITQKNQYYLTLFKNRINLLDSKGNLLLEYTPTEEKNTLSVGVNRLARQAQISRDEKYLFIGSEVFDISSQSSIYEINHRDDNLTDEEIRDIRRFTRVKFSGDNAHLMIVYPDGDIEVAHVKSGQSVYFINPALSQLDSDLLPAGRNRDPVSSALIVTDSSRIAGDSLNNYVIANKIDNTVDIWKYNTFKGVLVRDTTQSDSIQRVPVATLAGHTATINSIKISPDGETLITGSDDNLAMLWDLSDGKRKSILRGNTFPIKYIQFSESGDLIFTSDRKSRFSIWENKSPDKMDFRMKINPFEFYQRGFHKENLGADLSAMKLYQIDTAAIGAPELAGDLCHYMLSLPDKNLFPEDDNYTDGLRHSIGEIETLFDVLLNKPGFKRDVSTHFQDMVIDFYHSLQLRKFELLFEENSVNESLLYSQAMRYYLKDSIVQRRSARYALKLIEQSRLIKSSDRKLLSDNLSEVEYFYNQFEVYSDADKNELRRVGTGLNNLFEYFSYSNLYVKAFDVSSLLLSIDEKRNSSFWYSRSYYAIFAGEYDAAIEAVNKVVDFKEDQDGVYTNLALAYLYKNEWKKAEKVYLEWKDKEFRDFGERGNDIFIKDLLELERHGKRHPDFDKVYQILDPLAPAKKY